MYPSQQFSKALFIPAILILLLYASSSLAAITFGSVTTDTQTGSSVTFSHTNNSCSNMLLIVHAGSTTTSARVTAVTYASTGMTKAVENTGANSYNVIYYLVAPATGANNVVLTWSPAPATGRGTQAAVSYCGVSQTTPTGVTGTHDQGGVSVSSITVTSTAANSWLVSNSHMSGGPRTGNATSPNVERYNINETDGVRPYIGADQPTTAIGSYTSTYTYNDIESLGQALVEILEPSAGGAVTDTLMFMEF